MLRRELREELRRIRRVVLAHPRKRRMAARAPRVRARVVRRRRGRFAKRRKTNNFVELKFHDLDVLDALIAVGGTIAEDSVLTIAQGTTESQRIGRKLTVHSINWRFDMRLPSTAVVTDTSDVVRIILYLDKQTNGAAATVTGILETANFQSFNQLANKSRFRTLMDRTYVIECKAGSGRGSTDTLSYGEAREDDTLFLKNLKIPIEYDNSVTTGVITSIRSNNIGVLTLSEGGLVAFTSKMRIRFADG